MPSDYRAICDTNKAEYGNVGRWGRDVLVNRYDSSSHFIFEILQNAEDALKRRIGWAGSRAVRFELSMTELRIVHCGNPFTLQDVKGVCGVGETTKDLTDIGRFGIGFKSVYSVTNRPEVHSGAEDFAIESFVFPVAAPKVSRATDETVFVLPLRADDAALRSAIAAGLSELGPRTLLFLRQIEEIAWSVEGESNGLYLKGKTEEAGDGSRRVTLIGERDGKAISDETWLVFSREAKTDGGKIAGYIELSFLLQAGAPDKQTVVRRIDKSLLSAFFPTVVETHLGFLVQGPYRTTPSRDNVPPRDPWNVRLVEETADLLVEALYALKAQGLLDAAALQTLPLDRSKYSDNSMFAPLFEAVRDELEVEDLLPRAGGGWTSANRARLARTQELRDLFNGSQLASLLGESSEVHWLSGEITRDTAATLRNYLLRELDVTELTPEQVVPRLTKAFLEAQPDEWVLRLYEFLSGQPRLIQQGKVSSIPLVRLESGLHVVAESDAQPEAFLPSAIKTDFPIVRRSVCSTTKALELLKALGVTEPDAVDDVVRNILPKYKKETVEADGTEYEADIRRIVTAFGTQHRGQREKLIAGLKEASWVMSVDLGNGQGYVSQPADVYLPTERLKELLAGVPNAMVVDDSYACLRGEDIRELLEACGASRSLIQQEVQCTLGYQQLCELRRGAGCESMTGQETLKDHTLRSLPELLALLPSLSVEERRKRSKLLWEALKDVEQRRGTGAFSCTYAWTYYHRRTAPFDPEFVRTLSRSAWVPDADGELQSPEYVTFESLGWEPNPFLASKIRFKPPIIDQLAVESGIEPKVLELLKKRGLTSVAELVAALGDDEDELELAAEPSRTDDGTSPTAPGASDARGSVGDAIKSLLGGNTPDPSPPVPDPTANDPVGAGSGAAGSSAAAGPGSGRNGTAGTAGGGGAGTRRPGAEASDGTKRASVGGDGTGLGNRDGAAGGEKHGRRTPGSSGGRPFISYLGVNPTDDEPDPDELDHQKRMDLEAKAIAFVLKLEPALCPTPTNNKGYDLFEPGPDGQPVRWVEVKAMTGGLEDRPVGISIDQFECAQEHGEAFWLYVMEHAASDSPRLVKLQDPAGLARTFTFDRGWLNVAETVDSDTLTSDQSEEEA